jgi:hypothetical protein
MECEFESPISIAEDWPLKRLKTNAWYTTKLIYMLYILCTYY